MRYPAIVFLALLPALAGWAQTWTSYGIASPIAEVNTAGADVYPFITPNGLSLYFSRQDPDTLRMYVAKRNTVPGAFDTPVPALPASFPAGQAGCWLTPDELEIYFVSIGPTLYHATRSSMELEFDPPVALTLNGVESFYGPSLSPDREELVVGSNDAVLRLVRVGPEEYSFVDSIRTPLPFDPEIMVPGHFDPSGLSYYAARWYDGPSRFFLIRCYRAALGQPFTDWQYVSGSYASQGGDHFSPTITADSSLIVYTRNVGGWWPDNDIVKISAGNVGMAEAGMNDALRVVPGITSGPVELLLPSAAAGGTDVLLYALDGRVAGRWSMTGLQRLRLDLSGYPAGGYVFRVQGHGLDHRAPVVVLR